MTESLVPRVTGIERRHLQSLFVHEVSTGPVTAKVKCHKPTKFDDGQALEIKANNKSLFRGAVNQVKNTHELGNSSSELQAVAGAVPFQSTSLVCKELSLAGAMNKLVGKLAGASAAGSEKFSQVVVLGQAPWLTASRLALLGGCYLLNSARGPLLADPTAPQSPHKPAATFADITNRTQPELQLFAFQPGAFGQVSNYVAKGSSAGGQSQRFDFSMAASVSQLKSAAKAIQAGIRAGTLTWVGGPAALAVQVGDWIETHQQQHLVTSRKCSWSEDRGWRVELFSDYDWLALSAAPQLTVEPATVKGFQANQGTLQVTLPWHGIELEALVLASRAEANDLNVSIPRLGDEGCVLFCHGLDVAIYLGAPLAPGMLAEADFQNLVSLVKTAKLTERRGTDGKIELKYSDFAALAKIFKFGKAG